MAAFASEHLGITIDRVALPEVSSGEWDAVCSVYALAYLDPEDVLTTLTNCRNSKVKYLIFMEPSAYVHPFGPPGVYAWQEGGLPELAHDYAQACRDTGWSLLWRWPILPPAGGLNTLTIAERA
jgi:hypothetical protein